MSKRALVIRDRERKIAVFDSYISVDDKIIGMHQIEALYLVYTNPLPISECYKISKQIPLYLIDHNGYIKSTLSKVKDA